MTLVEIILLAAAGTAAAPHYFRGVRATAAGSLEAARFALAPPPRRER